MKPRFGEHAVGTGPMALLAYSLMAGRDIRGARPRFPPLQRAQIVELACLEPLAKGLHIAHWSSEDLACQVVADGIVATISPRTIQRILDEVDLQPHRTWYRRTTRADARFKERAEKVLWCYGNAVRLAAHGIWVVCADEMPNCQVLERVPIRRAIPGSIEQVEHDYIRHGRAEPRASEAAVRGEHGCGKTFFARWLADRARKMGFCFFGGADFRGRDSPARVHVRFCFFSL
jgi:Homeodomain-like domain/BREX system ATP-binding protein BrxC/D